MLFNPGCSPPKVLRRILRASSISDTKDANGVESLVSHTAINSASDIFLISFHDGLSVMRADSNSKLLHAGTSIADTMPHTIERVRRIITSSSKLLTNSTITIKDYSRVYWSNASQDKWNCLSCTQSAARLLLNVQILRQHSALLIMNE